MGIYVLNRTKYTKEQGKVCATEKKSYLFSSCLGNSVFYNFCIKDCPFTSK